MKRKMVALATATTLVLSMPLAALAAPAKKETICHIPPGNPANAHTITIGTKAVSSHMANHGDTRGACPDQPNRPPEADAGDDVCVLFGEPVTLDGSESSDPEGEELTYQWKIERAPQGSAATIGDATAATTPFNPDMLGHYKIELAVSDGERSDEDRVMVGVTMKVTLDSELYVVAAGESIPASIMLEGPAPAGGAEVHLTLTPAPVEESETPAEAHVALVENGEAVSSITIGAGEDGADFFVVGDELGSVTLAVQIGSDFCNRQDTAEVVVADSFIEAISIHIDEDLERLAADLEKLLEAGLAADPDFESSSWWMMLTDALISLGILIDDILDVIKGF